MTLQKVGKGYGGIVYTNEDNEALIRPANRKFENAKGKVPEMYLEFKEKNKDKKFKYFSGLFATRNEYVYTADEPTAIGLKVLYKVSFIGDTMSIERIKSLKEAR